MRRRHGRFAGASPIQIGFLIVITAMTAVYLSYSANDGLPFVPTYEVEAELPSGAKLVPGNEVRAGGFRVGIVKGLEPAYREVDGRRKAIAVVELKLEERLAPLPVDTRVAVRSKSSLGLKYVAITPGRSAHTLEPGATIPLEQTTELNDVEQILATFDARTRSGIRKALTGFGDGLAGRGPALNASIPALASALRHAEPAMRALAAPATRLDRFLPALERTTRELAPVAPALSTLFSGMADTFAAFGANPTALTESIERTPAFLSVAERSLGRSRPVLAQLEDVFARLEPSIGAMPRTLPPLTRALDAGTPVLAPSIDFSERLETVGVDLRDLMREPTTLLALGDVRTAFAVTRPLVEYASRPQTMCNYLVYWLTSVSDQQSAPAPGGTAQSAMARGASALQPNSPATTYASRAWDLPPGTPAQGATFGGEPAGRVLHVPPSGSVVDAQGNADCRPGQLGYPNGRILEPFHRKDGQSSDPNDPNDLAFGTLPNGDPAGWNARVEARNYPLLAGGTYITRKLGIENVRDLPR